jgi:hypothetical protein
MMEVLMRFFICIGFTRLVWNRFRFWFRSFLYRLGLDSVLFWFWFQFQYRFWNEIFFFSFGFGFGFGFGPGIEFGIWI